MPRPPPALGCASDATRVCSSMRSGNAPVLQDPAPDQPLLLAGAALRLLHAGLAGAAAARAGSPWEAIGLSSLLALPWALKFLWAPWVDRYNGSSLGPRRGWILPLQVLAIGAMALLALADAERALTWLLIAVFVTNPARRHAGHRHRRPRRRHPHQGRARPGQRHPGGRLPGRHDRPAAGRSWSSSRGWAGPPPS